MTSYLKTQATAKKGINFIKRIVKASNCEFHDIHQENDIGLDGIIELFDDEKPTGKMFSIQVKSGNSFVDFKKQVCKININQHYEYWLKHSLDVYGVVYVPDMFQAYFIDIKRYLLENPDDKVIKIDIINSNEFNYENFNNRIKSVKIESQSYLKRFIAFTDKIENGSYRLFFNNINIPLDVMLKRTLSVNTFIEMLDICDCKVLSLFEKDEYKQHNEMQQCSGKHHGEFYFSKNRHVYY